MRFIYNKSFADIMIHAPTKLFYICLPIGKTEHTRRQKRR